VPKRLTDRSRWVSASRRRSERKQIFAEFRQLADALTE
jgi:hypothetical protein